jgi:predicted PurR-regulated permease PerM
MNFIAELLHAILDDVFGRRFRRVVAQLLLVVVVFGGAGWVVNLEVQNVRHAIQPMVHYIDHQVRIDEHPSK